MSAFTYLALGDSYTIGEGVTLAESFPFLLQAKLERNGIAMSHPQVIAQTGWTTSQLMEAIEQQDVESTFDLVTLLIGVNNQYRGLPIEEFEKEIVLLVYKAIAFAGGNRAHVLVLTIPDYGYTPFGFSGQVHIEKQINAYNKVVKRTTQALDIECIDVTETGRQYSQQVGYLTEDELHPSEKMYQLWVDAIYPKVENLLCGL